MKSHHKENPRKGYILFWKRGWTFYLWSSQIVVIDVCMFMCVHIWMHICLSVCTHVFSGHWETLFDTIPSIYGKHFRDQDQIFTCVNTCFLQQNGQRVMGHTQLEKSRKVLNGTFALEVCFCYKKCRKYFSKTKISKSQQLKINLLIVTIIPSSIRLIIIWIYIGIGDPDKYYKAEQMVSTLGTWSWKRN